jgi:hypothetical protein
MKNGFMRKITKILSLVIVLVLNSCTPLKTLLEIQINFSSGPKHESALYIQFWNHEIKYPESENLSEERYYLYESLGIKNMSDIYKKLGLDTIVGNNINVHYHLMFGVDSLLIEKESCGKFLGYFVEKESPTDLYLYLGQQYIKANIERNRLVYDSLNRRVASFAGISLECYDLNYKISQHKTDRDSSFIKVFSEPAK